MRSVLSRRRRRARGFTLPELMAVVTIVGVMGAIAMATMSRSGDAENSAAYARSLEFAMMNARAGAISDGFQRRLNCTLSSTLGKCVVERATLAGMYPLTTAWSSSTPVVEQIISGGTRATLWNVTTTLDTTTSNAGGSQVTGTKYIYFRPDASICDQMYPTACTLANGMTVYISDTKNLGKSNEYKLWVYGNTGMPRLVNEW